MRDENGYAEFVIHPPPLNYFSLFIAWCVIKRTWMKTAAEIFSKVIFWFENLLYIILFFGYEVVLIPFIFFRVIFNVFKLAGFFRFLYIFFIWLVFGFLTLVYYALKDTFYYIRILCDYRDEEKENKTKEDEEYK